jgi:hypothetical protein
MLLRSFSKSYVFSAFSTYLFFMMNGKIEG